METQRRKIIIVDDNIANLTVGRNLLKAYYDVYLAPSAAQMFDMLPKVLPDLILLDIEMPDMDGYEAIKKLKSLGRFSRVPVVFLTAQDNDQSELKGFELGAVDYISKPFSPPLLLKRIEHQLLIVSQQEMIRAHTNNLSVLVSEKVGEVTSLQNAILGTVADLVEFRDQFTGGHVMRTQLYLKAIIDGLAKSNLYSDRISDWKIDSFFQSAQLHDVGKIAIPDAILNKPSRLTADEFEIMKTHVTVGIDAINRIIGKTREHTFLLYALNFVSAHHEKWDGTGYPYGLSGESIPLEGRLMAIADVYDALVSWRPYKEKMPHEKAKRIILEGRGTHFDPVLVDVFQGMEKVFEQIASDDPAGRWCSHVYTSDMEIGEPVIDAQHRGLIEMLNTVMSMNTDSSSKENARELLDYLGNYVSRHFADEERLQRKSGYPKYEWHLSQHQIFSEEFKKLKSEFTESGFTPEFYNKLTDSVTAWIVRHIKTVDAEFGKYLQLSAPPDSAPRRLQKTG